jgi:hypothetical protein
MYCWIIWDIHSDNAHLHLPIKAGQVIRGLLEKYPTFGREKETGLPGALDT